MWCFACAPKLEKLDDVRSARGSLGEEVYKVLCRRVAGTEIPDDLDGRETETLCLGSASQVAGELDAPHYTYPARLRELAVRRAQLVRAVDETFPKGLGDELELLMRQLLPFYDPPDELFQNGTRAFAAVLKKIAANDAALTALESVGRTGMVARDGDLGLYRSVLGYDQLSQLFAAILPVLTQDKGVEPELQTMLAGLALELATTTLDDAPDSDTRRLKDLLGRQDSAFGTGKALLVAARDARGMPVPTALGGDRVPFPFVDQDNDGAADVKDGRFVADPNFGRDIPEPLTPVSESSVERDDQGRAYAFTADGKVDHSRSLFVIKDYDRTLLAGLLREGAKVFGEKTQVAVHLARVFPALFGKRVEAERRYGSMNFAYSAVDTDQSPLLDLVYASTVLLDRSLYEQSLELSETLLTDHEAELVGSIEPLLTLEKRTRAASDAYPEAKLADKSTFWDELLLEVEKISRRRKTADGPTMLELLLRGALGYGRNLEKTGAPVEQLQDPKALSHQGAMIAALMRYKDEWRNNPVGASKRAPGDPATIGGFRTPVDRTKPDTPVTCGKDGCGGPIAGTPFERWAHPGQNCVLQRDGRPSSSKQCGAPANQSILQRSLGLIVEMAGRAQCNKALTLGDLIDFALIKDPCQNLDTQVSCTNDLECSDAFKSTDYGCGTNKLCVAKSGTNACSQLKQKQQQDRQNTIVNGENKLHDDYCHPDSSGACLPGSAAFVDPDGPNKGVPSTILACDLLNIADVGRSFGRALTHEFQIKIPNPWLHRYLEDVAFAGIPTRPDCPSNFRITNPAVDPGCVTGAASLSRDVYKDMPADVDTLGELIEYLLDDKTLFTTDKDLQELRPDVGALTRVLFAPAGSAGLLMFDPLLIHGAPPICAPNTTLPACVMDDTAPTPKGGCCIADSKKPPFRYRLDTYYGSTSSAWDQPVQFEDGTSISLVQAMKTLADAANRTDYDAEAGDDPNNFEGTDYVFSTIGKIVGVHYDSRGNSLAQNTDPNAAHYRTFTNLVSYERLLADAFDDGTADASQLGPDGKPLFEAQSLPKKPEEHLGLIAHAYPLLETVSGLTVGAQDGLAFSASLGELLLNPHAYCAPEGGDKRVTYGLGACDLVTSDNPPAGFRAPLTYRDGRSTICWNDGRCFDHGSNKQYVNALYLLLDPIAAIHARIAGDPKLDEAYQGVRAGVFDEFLGTADAKLSDRRFRALVLTLLGYAQERWLAEQQKGTLATLGPKTLHDAVDFVASPLFAGGLGMIQGLSDEPDAMAALNRFGANLFGTARDEAQLRALLGAAADLVSTMPGNQNFVELEKVMALGIIPDVDEIVQDPRKCYVTPTADARVTAGVQRSGCESKALSLQDGMIWRDLVLLREAATRDDKAVLSAVMSNAAAIPGYGTKDARPSPLAELFDLLMAINRLEIGATTALSAAEWKAVTQRIADVMLDDRRGFERLYQVVQCRNGDRPGVTCD